MTDRIRVFLKGPEARRIGRFLVVGGGLFGLDLCLFLVFVKLAGLDVWWAQTLSVSIRTALGFVLHKWFTFAGDTKSDASSTAKQSVAYIVQGVVNIPISAAVVTACVWATGGYALVGKVLSEGVLAVWVFFLYRFVVWRPEPTVQAQEPKEQTQTPTESAQEHRESAWAPPARPGPSPSVRDDGAESRE